MKKIVLFICILLIPFMVYAEDCDSTKITVESIELKNLTGSAEDVDSSIENKKINLNVKLKEVGDSAEYDVKINNSSTDEYYLDETNIKSNNEYINYSITYDDNTNIIQPKSNKEVNIRVEYRNEVPDEMLENNSFVDNSTFTLDIADEKPKSINNPTTFNAMIYIMILIGIVLLMILLRKKNNIQAMILIIGIAIIIPLTVSAVCNANIECETNVTVEKGEPFPNPKYFAFGTPTTSSTQDYTTVQAQHGMSGSMVHPHVFATLYDDGTSYGLCFDHIGLKCYRAGNNGEFNEETIAKMQSELTFDSTCNPLGNQCYLVETANTSADIQLSSNGRLEMYANHYTSNTEEPFVCSISNTNAITCRFEW